MTADNELLLKDDGTMDWTWTCHECEGTDTEHGSPRDEPFSEAVKRLGLRTNGPGYEFELWCRACSAKTEEELAAARVARALAPTSRS